MINQTIYEWHKKYPEQLFEKLLQRTYKQRFDVSANEIFFANCLLYKV